MRVEKTRLIAVVALFLLASASATVELRDNMDAYGVVDMNGNQVENLGAPDDEHDAATKEYVDNQTSKGFNWSDSYQVSDGDTATALGYGGPGGGSKGVAKAQISCQQEHILKEVMCSVTRTPSPCDYRNRGVANVSSVKSPQYFSTSTRVSVSGTCVPRL